MYNSKKSNKINPSLSGSRRQSKSYLQRYKQKAQNNAKSSSTLYSKQQTSLTAQISQSEHMLELTTLEADIKIEQEMDQYQYMTSQYLQAQRIWTTQINQIKNQINELKEGVKSQQKYIKEIEKETSTKRARLIALQQKLQKSKETLQSIVLQDYDQLIDTYQTEYNQINQIGERQINQAQHQYKQLQQQNEQIDIELKEIEEQLVKRPSLQSQKYNGNLTSFLEEQEQLKIQLTQIQSQTKDILSYIKELEQSRPLRQQVHRKYLQLYQKMFVNQQLDIMSELIDFKNRQIQRMEDYTKRKVRYRQKKAEIEQIEYRIVNKKQIISKLQEDIRDCSTKLLNLYQMEL